MKSFTKYAQKAQIEADAFRSREPRPQYMPGVSGTSWSFYLPIFRIADFELVAVPRSRDFAITFMLTLGPRGAPAWVHDVQSAARGHPWERRVPRRPVRRAMRPGEVAVATALSGLLGTIAADLEADPRLAVSADAMRDRIRAGCWPLVSTHPGCGSLARLSEFSLSGVRAAWPAVPRDWRQLAEVDLLAMRLTSEPIPPTAHIFGLPTRSAS